MRGRKRKGEYRATEFRQKIVEWQQAPESLRPSLRALARELGTTHQPLRHCCDRIESWKVREKAKRIRARAETEGRDMTVRECLDAIITPGVLAQIESLRRAARRGPLNSWQVKTLKLWAQHFPVAQEVLASSRAMTLQEERADRDRQAHEQLEEYCNRALAEGRPLSPQVERRYLVWLRKVIQ